jgi:hypothetical protein
MWVHDIDIIDEEHAMEGFGEEHDLFRHESVSIHLSHSRVHTSMYAVRRRAKPK